MFRLEILEHFSITQYVCVFVVLLTVRNCAKLLMITIRVIFITTHKFTHTLHVQVLKKSCEFVYRLFNGHWVRESKYIIVRKTFQTYGFRLRHISRSDQLNDCLFIFNWIVCAFARATRVPVARQDSLPVRGIRLPAVCVRIEGDFLADLNDMLFPSTSDTHNRVDQAITGNYIWPLCGTEV